MLQKLGPKVISTASDVNMDGAESFETTYKSSSCSPRRKAARATASKADSTLMSSIALVSNSGIGVAPLVEHHSWAFLVGTWGKRHWGELNLDKVRTYEGKCVSTEYVKRETTRGVKKKKNGGRRGYSEQHTARARSITSTLFPITTNGNESGSRGAAEMRNSSRHESRASNERISVIS